MLDRFDVSAKGRAVGRARLGKADEGAPTLVAEAHEKIEGALDSEVYDDMSE